MVDREAKRAEGKGIGYDRWASMHKLKAWSKTFMYLQEHDLLSPDKLIAAVDAAGAEAREARSRYDAAAAKVTDKKAMLEAMDNYRNTYPVIKEYRMIRKEKGKQKFYAAHEADFIISDAAKRQLDKLGAPKQLPKRKEVVAEIQSLVIERTPRTVRLQNAWCGVFCVFSGFRRDIRCPVHRTPLCVLRNRTITS